MVKGPGDTPAGPFPRREEQWRRTIVAEPTPAPNGDLLALEQPQGFMDRFNETIRYVRGRGALEITLLFLLANVVAYVVGRFATSFGDAMFKDVTLKNFGQSVPPIALLAIAAGIIMVVGELDLSIGAIYVHAAIVFLTWYGGGRHAIVAGIVAIAWGVGMSLVNGIITLYLNIDSFIVTLGGFYAWEGLTIYYSHNRPAIIQPSESLSSWVNGEFLGLQSQIYWLVIIGVIMWFLMHRHRFGNQVQAVGGNEAAARAISIPPRKVKLLTWAVAGALISVAAILVAVRTKTMQPGSGRTLPLQVIAAAVIGGVSLHGGKGSVLGMIIGACFMWWIQAAVLFSPLDATYWVAFLGVFLVVLAFFNVQAERKVA